MGCSVLLSVDVVVLMVAPPPQSLYPHPSGFLLLLPSDLLLLLCLLLFLPQRLKILSKSMGIFWNLKRRQVPRKKASPRRKCRNGSTRQSRRRIDRTEKRENQCLFYKYKYM